MSMTKSQTRVKHFYLTFDDSIRALRYIRLSLTEEMVNVVVCALVQSRVD